MIQLTKLHGEKIVVNADLIEFVEAIPETMITLTTGKKIMVRESVDEIIQRVAAFKRATARTDGSGRIAISDGR